MSVSFHVNSGAVQTFQGGTAIAGFGTGDSYGGDEANSAVTCRVAGTFSKLQITILANTLSGSATFKSRKNNADGNQSITIGAGLTGIFYDDVNTDSVSAGDEFDCGLVASAGTGIITRGSIGVSFTPASNTVVFLSSNGIIRSFEGAGADMFCGPMLTSMTITEVDAQVRIPVAGILKNLFVNATANTDPSAETITLRINGVDTALTVTIPANTTGIVEDTTHSVSVSANDLVSWRITRTGSVAGGFWWVNPLTVNFETSNDAFVMGGGSVVGQTSASGETKYFLAWEYRNGEADQQLRLFNSCTFSKLRILVKTNATTSPSTFDLRKNESSSALTVTIAAGTTGAFVDDSNSAPGFVADRINFRLVNGGGGNLIWTSCSMLILTELSPPIFTIWEGVFNYI